MAKKILLIDDEPELVEMVKMRLVASGFDVITAGDGADGLAKARGEKPDLIILDLMLPKMNGYEVCRLLKFEEKTSKIPIVLFSARAQEADKVAGKDVGADAYIVKPFEPQALMSKIKELLGE